AREIIENANKEVEAAIRQIRESKGDKKTIQNARERLRQQRESLTESVAEKSNRKPVDIGQLQIGQYVRSRQYDIKGNLSKIFPNKKTVEIDKDGLKISVDLADIEVLDEHGRVVSEGRPAVAERNTGTAVSANIPGELNLRGLLAHEAVMELESYLDNALLSERDEVRIVHGKGSGALRQAVHDYLRKRNDIEDFRLGKWGEGETGVTIVRLT
ncbi:MAG: hypothetical protein GF313_13075, partial [Caldithrix sp.]|nr:hypothetical protein [Caldithrix sp.]